MEINIVWSVIWVLWHINLCRFSNAKSIFMKVVLFQTIQFRISMQFKCKYNCEKHFYFKLFSLVFTIRLFTVISGQPFGGGSYPSAEVKLVYSTAPADWAMEINDKNNWERCVTVCTFGVLI